jgi:hypothetical protein
MPVRIATFNCENLFSRAKVLDLTDSATDFAAATAALNAADQLRAVLRSRRLPPPTKRRSNRCSRRGKASSPSRRIAAS